MGPHPKQKVARSWPAAVVAAVLVSGLLAPSTAAAAPATHLTVSTINNVRSGDVFQVQVQARDNTEAVDTGFSGSISLSAAATDGSDFSVTPSQTANTGSATFNVILNNAANNYIITASSTGLTADNSNSFHVTAHHLTVTTAIANVRSGDSFNVTVQARDNNNAAAENFGGSVSLSAAAAGGANFNGGSPTASAVTGTVAFTGLVLNNAANNYTITASSVVTNPPNNGISNSFNVTAHHLTVTTAIANVRSGDGFNMTVQARDANNAVAENFAGSVSLSAAAAGGSNFSVTPSQPASAGSATFTGLVLNNAANNYTITASSAVTNPPNNGVSNSFNVTAHHLTVTTAIANVRSGDGFNLTVQARDGNNAVAENFGGTVTLSAAATGGSDFAATPSQIASAGSATFTGLELNDAANNYTITASSAVTNPPNNGVSNSFNVTAHHLTVLPVANVQSGDSFNVTVEARDIDDAVAENFTGSVSLSAAAPLGSGFASGSPSDDATAGSATFDGLVLNDAGDDYRITASSSGLTDAPGNAFIVTADHLVVVTAIPNKVAGSSFSVTVEARDANNSLAENFSDLVSVSAAAVIGGSNFVGGTRNVSAASGTVTFDGLKLNKAANGYTVTAQSTGIPIAISNAFNVTAAKLARTVSLRLRNHLVASGVLRAGGSSRCIGQMAVRIQRRSSGRWTTIKTATTTGTGAYNVRLGDKAGRYRAAAPKATRQSPTTLCGAATSPARVHSH